jgi:phage shock protein PspC (stress-responsive transcriptional regulator)
MTQYQLLWKTYEIPKTSADFLDSYIKRLKSYISSNNISESYLDDILERMNDKLTQLEIESSPIKNADIIKIVNDIGEAEDIFPKENKNTHEKIASQNMFQKWLKRDSENAILFWVCAGIANHISIDPLWVRIVFIILVFSGWIGIVIYIILIFLIPSDKKTQVSNTTHITKPGIINQLSSLVGSSFRGIFWLFLSVVFGAIGLGLIGVFIAGVVISGLILSGSFIIANQEFLTGIPDSMRIALPLLSITTLVIVVAIFGSIIGRDLFGRRGWLMVVFSIAIGSILFATGSITLVKNYSWAEHISTSTGFAFSGTSINIDNQLWRFTNGNKLTQGIFDSVIVESSNTGNTIQIDSIEEFYTKDQALATQIIKSRNSPIFTLSGNTLLLSKSGSWDFQNLVPFSFFNRTIRITIPQNIEIKNIKGRYDSIEDIREPDEIETPEIPEVPEVPQNS